VLDALIQRPGLALETVAALTVADVDALANSDSDGCQ